MSIRRIGITLFFSSIALFLSGCHLVILEPTGSVARDEKNILITAVCLMLIVVIPVILLTLIFAWRYRANNKQAVYAPNWSHNAFIEVVCWFVPCVIVFILSIITYTSSYRLDPYHSLTSKTKPLVVEVIALQWKWLFIYPEKNIATINFLELPINTPVTFLISDEGPMNSFQIPALAGQIYAMAGMQTKLHLIANKLGDYEGLSTNFSGDGFSDMKFTTRVSTSSAFDQWVASVQKTAPTTLTKNKYELLLKPTTHDAIQYFRATDKNIYDTVKMKGMMPMHHESGEKNHAE